MSDKKPASMDEFLKISQSKRAENDKEKKKKEKDKDKGKPKEPAGKKTVDKKSSAPAESAAQPSSRDIFALLEETDTEATTKIRGKIMDVVQSLVQAYGEIPINRIAKRIPDETEERVMSVLEDLIIAGAIKARLSTDKIIPVEGTSKISVDKSAVKGKSGAVAPVETEEAAKPEIQKPAGRSKAAPPEPPKLVAPSLVEPPSIAPQKPQKGAGKGIVPAPSFAPRAPSIPAIPELPLISLSPGKHPMPQVEDTEIPDFPNPEPAEPMMAKIPAPAPMEQPEAPEPTDIEAMEAVPAPPVVPIPRAIQKPGPAAPGIKPALKPMKMPAPKAPSVPAPKAPSVAAPKAPSVPAPKAPSVPAPPMQRPAAPKVPAIQKPAAPKVPAIQKPATPKMPAVPPAVPIPPAQPSIKPAPGMRPVKPAKASAAPAAPAVPQVPRMAAAPVKPAKPMSKEEQAAYFEQKINEMLQDRPEELSLVYKLFENPKLALLGFDEDWIAGALGTTTEHAVELIKFLRGLNIVKLGPSGLNFVINTNL